MATWKPSDAGMRAADQAVDILLVGGGVASVRCARTLRRSGFDGSILLVGAEEHAPYNRPPLSKELLRSDLPDELVAAEPPTWYERRAVDLRTALAITSLDPDARVAVLSDGLSVAFDRCLLATGAAPRALPVPGGERAILLRTLADSRRLRKAATEARAGAGAGAVVIGGSFIGIEVASVLAEIGLRPTIVELADRLWAGTLGASLADWAMARLTTAGVEVRLGAGVTRVEDGAVRVGDEQLPSAFVVAGIGVRPRVDLAASAGLEVDDGIVTDVQQRTSHPAIWAAGDVARAGEARIEHWHAAREAGERAALSMLGAAVPSPKAPWFFSEVAGSSLDVFGAATGSAAESWVHDSVLAYTDGERVVQLAVIGSAVDPALARALVDRGATLTELREALDPSPFPGRL